MKDKKNNNSTYSVEKRNPLVNSTSVPGINTPEIAPPAFNPPVPNRAWTAMKNGKDIDELTDEEKRMLYYGKDEIL